jgi:hypothetical protein
MDTSSIIKDLIIKNEKIFRSVLKDAIDRQGDIPRRVQPSAQLEELLQYVPRDRHYDSSFRISVFSVGPSEQPYSVSLRNNQVVLGYKSFYNGWDEHEVVLLYSILAMNNRPEYRRTLRGG